jgi:hypothetical protein
MNQEKNENMYTHLTYRRNGPYARIIQRVSRPGICVETMNLRGAV